MLVVNRKYRSLIEKKTIVPRQKDVNPRYKGYRGSLYSTCNSRYRDESILSMLAETELFVMKRSNCI